MSFINFKNYLRIAGTLLLAILFSDSANSQKFETPYLSKETIEKCQAASNNYIANGSVERIWFRYDSLAYGPIKKLKLTSEQLKISKIGTTLFLVSAEVAHAGPASIQAKINFKDKTKLVLEYHFTVVELPELEVEITVTSPDSKFMWLNLKDKNTGQSANSSFNLCSINFVLTDSAGTLKESGKSEFGDEYFPSVTLRQLPIHFDLNDRLNLEIVLTHYEYNLPVFIKQELTIQQLWN